MYKKAKAMFKYTYKAYYYVYNMNYIFKRDYTKEVNCLIKRIV